MEKTSINVDHVARIEGHGNIRVVIEDDIVKTVEMSVVEPARLFESMVVGRPFNEIPYIASRICGICSASHTITDINAIERVFDVQVTDRTRALRELLMHGSYLQNHAAHLFVFATPDFLGMKSVFPLAEINPALLNKALGLKALGNELCNRVGGRSIHPITAVVGGFTNELKPEEYLELAGKLEDMYEFARETVDLFDGFEVPDIQTEGDMLALASPDAYPLCTGREARFIDAGVVFDADDTNVVIEEYEMPHSAAKLARVRETKKPYFTGSLARINAAWDKLGKEAKMAAAKAGLRPPERNPFMNNLAQCIEIIDTLEHCIMLLYRLAESDGFEGSSEPVKFEIKAGKGMGFSEAPRGVLFHELELDEAGRVKHASIITPTSQNVANLEADMRLLAEKLVADGWEKDAIQLEIEKLVRAYDPCLSCSVH